MSAFPYEYELAKKDGVIFLWQTQPVRVLGGTAWCGPGMHAHGAWRAGRAREAHA